MKRKEIRLSGAGGQGMILAGIILAESSLFDPELYVVQTQSYGPESRGGASRAEVIVSREPIDYPKVVKADILVCLTAESLEKYGQEVAEGGVVIADDSFAGEDYIPPEGVDFYSLPIIAKAREEIGLEVTANMVALGAVDHFLSEIDSECLEQAIEKRVPGGTEEKNMAAFRAGQQLLAARV